MGGIQQYWDWLYFQASLVPRPSHTAFSQQWKKVLFFSPMAAKKKLCFAAVEKNVVFFPHGYKNSCLGRPGYEAILGPNLVQCPGWKELKTPHYFLGELGLGLIVSLCTDH